MNNKLYEQIWSKIAEHDTITIFTHVNPDGDTIGTSLALKELINLNYPNIEVKISGDKYPYNLNFLDSNDEVSEEYIKNSLSVLVDTSSIERTFDKRILLSKKIIKIDHHHPEGDQWFLAVEGDVYPSAGQIIFEMIEVLGLETNKKIAVAIFVAIWTDTSGLIERNPDEQTFDAIKWTYAKGVIKNKILKKMKLNEKDQAKVNELISGATIKGKLVYKINDEIVSNDVYRPATEEFVKRYEQEVYIFATKINTDTYRIGLRSKEYDVSRIAEKFNGGGHNTSSGAKVKSMEEIKQLIKLIEWEINE